MVIFFFRFSKAGTVKCLIVGGGKIGLEKLSAILKNSPATQVRLVATVISSEVRALSSDYRNVSLLERPYQPADLIGHDLVIAATNDGW